MSGTDRTVILYKRWRLREEVTLDDVVALVTQAVAPHYGALDTRVVLGLEAQGGDAILAIQRWPSRDVLAQATTSPRFQDWWQAYQPVLAAWDALVEFDSEWETEDLLD
jgi:hypothetical protein